MDDTMYEVDADILKELIHIALDKDCCPNIYTIESVDNFSDSCPGYKYGVACEDCWLDYIGID